jgi:hypothetical protein
MKPTVLQSYGLTSPVMVNSLAPRAGLRHPIGLDYLIEIRRMQKYALCFFFKPIIPLFQHSIIPIVSEANDVRFIRLG